jgi:uncharacterized protein YuzE
MELVNTDPKTGQVGSLYLRLSEAAVAKTVPVKDAEDPECLVDLDRHGKVVGVEVLGQDMIQEVCAMIAKRLPRPYKAEVRELCEA